MKKWSFEEFNSRRGFLRKMRLTYQKTYSKKLHCKKGSLKRNDGFPLLNMTVSSTDINTMNTRFED